MRAMSLGRWVAAALGLALTVGGAVLAVGPYRDLRAYEKAGHCATPSPGSARDCIASAQVTVVSRSTYTTPDNDTGPDPNWPPPQPPNPQPPMGPPLRVARTVVNAAWRVAAVSETTHYRVTVRTDDGHRRTYTVTAALYEAATTGTRARADLWHGRITRLTIGAESVEIPPDSGFDNAWLMGWAGVMLLVWAVPASRVHLGIALWLWWTGNVVYHMLGSWDPAWYVIPLLIAGSVLAWKARETVVERRRRLRYARVR